MIAAGTKSPAFASNPVSVAFLMRSREQPEQWARYAKLCDDAGISPWPEQVDPTRVMRDPRYATSSALAASMRLEFTRQVRTDP